MIDTVLGKRERDEGDVQDSVDVDKRAKVGTPEDELDNLLWGIDWADVQAAFEGGEGILEYDATFMDEMEGVYKAIEEGVACGLWAKGEPTKMKDHPCLKLIAGVGFDVSTKLIEAFPDLSDDAKTSLSPKIIDDLYEMITEILDDSEE